MTEVNRQTSVETDIALIKHDIKQIERFFKKVDDAITQMSELLKTVAVQETILESQEKRIGIVEQKITQKMNDDLAFREDVKKELNSIRENARDGREKNHKEMMDALSKMHNELAEKLDQQDKRIRVLENWRWYVIGISAAVIFLITKFPWSSYFG